MRPTSLFYVKFFKYKKKNTKVVVNQHPVVAKTLDGGGEEMKCVPTHWSLQRASYAPDTSTVC